jgi:hypothetical protein
VLGSFGSSAVMVFTFPESISPSPAVSSAGISSARLWACDAGAVRPDMVGAGTATAVSSPDDAHPRAASAAGSNRHRVLATPQ